MSDITKCKSEQCPIKQHCKRHTAESGLMQSWFTETPGKWECHPDDLQKHVWQCNMFWGDEQEGILEYLQNIVK